MDTPKDGIHRTGEVSEKKPGETHFLRPDLAMEKICRWLGISGPATRLTLRASMQDLATVEVEFLAETNGLSGETGHFRLEQIEPSMGKTDAMAVHDRLGRILAEGVTYGSLRQGVEGLLEDLGRGTYGH